MGVDATAVQDAVASLARSFKRVSVYRHARDQHASYLEPGLASMRGLLELAPSVTLTVEPNALLFEGERVHTEPARETGFCFRLHRDGVRSLTFRRGLGLDELLSLAYAAMAEPRDPGGREDAVTELWKADLAHVSYSAGAGYRMDESAGDEIHATVSEIAGRVQETVEKHVGDRFVEVSAEPRIWTDELLRKHDPEDYPGLARRAAMTILRIVEQDYAGWDMEALQETFWRLCDQLLDRAQPAILGRALEKLRGLGGSHAGEFRGAMSRWLCTPERVARVVALAGTERPALLPPWLALLPPDAGPLLVPAIGAGRDAGARHQLAAGALARIDSCGQQLSALMKTGTVEEVQALLWALQPQPPNRRAELAEAALLHGNAALRLEALPLVAADAPVAVRALGPALVDDSRALRVAAVQALGACGALAEQASTLMLAAMARPQFARVDKDEQTLFYRALGRLGSATGFSFLLERLARPPRKLFGKRKGVDDQLLAVQGLAEEASQRSLRALEDALVPSRGHAPAVVAACRAAAQYVRERERPRGGRSA